MDIKKGVIYKPPQDNENETWIYFKLMLNQI